MEMSFSLHTTIRPPPRRIFLFCVIVLTVMTYIRFMESPTLVGTRETSIWGDFGIPLLTASSTTPSLDSTKTKTILYYTSYWHKNDFQFGLGTLPFHENQCPVKNCRIESRSLLNLSSRAISISHNLSDFDAVLFSVQKNDKFDITEEQQSSIDIWRSPHQRFIFFMMESQSYPILKLEEMNHFFNWTMTFRWDSDIPRPYGWFEKKTTTIEVEDLRHRSSHLFYPHKHETWIPYDEEKFLRSLPSRPKTFHDLARRPGKIAWIVSKCDTHSRREDYVYHLRKYIQVDEFGRGNCQGENSAPTTCDQPYSATTVDNCTTHVMENYKFYLGFENQFCNDYVTEKFFQRMEDSVVITLGQANYSGIAPPHSSISVFDFDNVQDLAAYLLELDQDDEKYLSYFWWKDYYTVRHSRRTSHRDDLGNGFGPSMCQLCAKLHDPTEPPKIYESMENWWRTPGDCGQKLQSLQDRMTPPPALGKRGGTNHLSAFLRTRPTNGAGRN